MDNVKAGTPVPVFGKIIQGTTYVKRPGSYGIILNIKKEVCLVKIKNDYALPGGGMDDNETAEETLFREVKEETGFSIAVKYYGGTAIRYVFSEGEGGFEKICSYFICDLISDMVNEPIEKDHTPGWFTIQEAIEKIKEMDEAHHWALSNFL